MTASRTRVALMGATGSIGSQTLEVLRREPERFELIALSAGRRVDELAALVKEFQVRHVGVSDDDDRRRLGEQLGRLGCADLVVLTGFLGGLTTFSTFSAELARLLQQGRLLMVAAEITLHVAGSVTLTMLGIATVVAVRRLA